MAAQPLAEQVGVVPACRALGVSRATFYRRQRSTPGHQQPRPTPARALCEAEREQVLDELASPRFVDRAPAEVVATLLDEGRYLCSERTMYRILAADRPVRERRNQREHPQYTKPELVAWAPNQTWSWDITKLLGPTKWTYFYLYVVLDIFSRYAVGWLVADRENSALAGRLIEETCHKQGVQPQVLTLHSDRGSPMTSKCTAQLLADLGVTRSLSRPQVSDDNPFSEAQFKTLKYHPGFPDRFHDITAAIAFCRTFFPWYNTEHRHGGIAMLTPDDVHHHRAQSVLDQRGRTLQAAWTQHPERFVRGIPEPDALPEAVWINPPVTSTTGEIAQQMAIVSVSKSLTGSVGAPVEGPMDLECSLARQFDARRRRRVLNDSRFARIRREICEVTGGRGEHAESQNRAIRFGVEPGCSVPSADCGTGNRGSFDFMSGGRRRLRRVNDRRGLRRSPSHVEGVRRDWKHPVW